MIDPKIWHRKKAGLNIIARSWQISNKTKKTRTVYFSAFGMNIKSVCNISITNICYQNVVFFTSSNNISRQVSRVYLQIFLHWVNYIANVFFIILWLLQLSICSCGRTYLMVKTLPKASLVLCRSGQRWVH